MKRFAIVLSGCGVFDGAEINESVFCLLAMSKHSISYDIFAPSIPQYHVINHLTNEPMDEKRNVLVEAARIARGEIKDLNLLNMSDYDALILPGGAGAVKNFSSYAFEDVHMKVLPEIQRVIIDCNKQQKPIAALCISPIVVAKVLSRGKMTLGHSEAESEHIEELGATHVALDSNEYCVDEKNKIYTVAAYMNDASMADIYDGIDKMIEEIVRKVN